MDESIFGRKKDLVSSLDYFYVIHGAVEVILEKVVRGVTPELEPIREYNLKDFQARRTNTRGNALRRKRFSNYRNTLQPCGKRMDPRPCQNPD